MRSVRPPPTVPVLALVLGALALPASGRILVSCDSGPMGLSSLAVEAPAAGIEVLEEGDLLVIEVADAGNDLTAGALRCPPAKSVQVVPGRLLGLPISRVLVTSGPRRPSVVRADGRVRLLWLPGRASGDSRANAEPARAPAPAPQRRSEPQSATLSERPSAPPAAPASLAPEPPPAARELPTSGGPFGGPAVGEERIEPARRAPADPAVPPDFLPLERPVAMVASVDTELRAGPGRRFPVKAPLAPGRRIEIDGRAGDWIRTVAGEWAFGPYFEAPEEALDGGAFVARILAINAPVHAGPAAHHEIVAELYRDEQVVVDEVKAEWAHVRDGGWIRMSELSRGGKED